MTTLSVDNPATGEVFCEIETASAEDAAQIVGRARAAADTLAELNLAERIELCSRFIDRFAANRERIARDVTGQMGKPISQSRGEISTAIDRARCMIELAPQCLADEPLDARGGFERVIQKRPVGVVLDIAAWNYPLLIPVNVVVPAVLAGNAVVLKHSARTPLCAGHFADAFAAAGAPADSVIALVAGHDVTAGVIADRAIDYVAFTGSVEGGVSVSRAAGGRPIDVGLELGGKDPAYVREDADLQSAAAGIAEGAFYNSGQSCCAVERIYVARSVHDEFVELLLNACREWTPCTPERDESTLGPMAQADSIATITRQLEDAAGRGAQIASGGHAVQIDGRGRYFEPTVVTGATDDMLVMREETFGPVAAVAAVDDDTEAVARMNDSDLGLTASVWTRDLAAARHLGSRIEAGTVFMNRCDFLDPELPWTGWKDSGVGITLSRYGFDRMVRTRALHFRLPA
jgi:acyl-CoA reductase-like NAD-dependent aldehyde dehydrogenase